MEHRRFLTHSEVHRCFFGSDIHARIGGGPAINALIDGLYDRIESDPALRPLFGRDLTNERDQGTDGGRATALHYAAKAGFVKTIGVLLEHEADPSVRDDKGLTALDWVDRAAKSVDRDGVRRLLQRPGTR